MYACEGSRGLQPESSGDRNDRRLVANSCAYTYTYASANARTVRRHAYPSAFVLAATANTDCSADQVSSAIPADERHRTDHPEIHDDALQLFRAIDTGPQQP